MEAIPTYSEEEQGATFLLERGPQTTAPGRWRSPTAMAATCSLLLAAGYLLSWPLAKGFTSPVAVKVGDGLTFGRSVLIAQQGSPSDPSQKLSCVFPADLINKLNPNIRYNTDFKNGPCFMDLTPLPPGGDVFGYQFRLTFTYPDHTWHQLNWLQESDPTNRRITGFKPLDSYTSQAEYFKGLGVTPIAPSGSPLLHGNQLDLCLIDSSPVTGYQWNCVGSTKPYPLGCDIASENCGIAGVQSKPDPQAFAMTLEYIWPATACCFSFVLNKSFDPVDLKTNVESYASCVKDVTIHSNFTGWTHDRCPKDAAEAWKWWRGAVGALRPQSQTTEPLTPLTVINGKDAPECTYKSMASIGLSPPGDGSYGHEQHQCGGTILSDTVILSAAHCFLPENPALTTVVVGRTNLDASGGQQLTIRKVERSQYDPYTRANDWAIVFLTSAISWNECVAPALLSEKTPPSSTVSIVTGWGHSCVNGQVSPGATAKLQQGDTKLSDCLSNPPPHVVCASTDLTHQDAASGDSGGPLWCSVGVALQQCGLVSYGPPDNCPQPLSSEGVYTDVAFFRNNIYKAAGLAP